MKKKLYLIVSLFFSFLLIIGFSLTIYGALRINVLPFKYLLVLVIISIIILICFLIFLFKKKCRILIYLFSVILLIVLGIIIYYEFVTLNFFDKIDNSVSYSETNYYLLVSGSSIFNSLDDLSEHSIGVLSEEMIGQKEALQKISKYNLKEKKYMDNGLLINALKNGDVDSILLEEAIYNLLVESDPKFKDSVKVINENTIIVENVEDEQQINSSNVDDNESINKTDEFDESLANKYGSFNIYISGIDTNGSIDKVSRSDVNIILTVNPKTHKVLITHIPRDYYIYRHNTTWMKDKLAHVAYYGINSSVDTIEDLLNIKIKYYVKVNFTSVEKIVDLLGGIDINSQYDFNSGGYHYNYGINHLNGSQTLAFVRQRKALNGGDRARGTNQQIVLEALINKGLSSNILTNYNNILSEVINFVSTNVKTSEIITLINNQISSGANWSISRYNLNGIDSKNYTYSNPTDYNYVMEPDYETVAVASTKIKNICYGK